MVPQNTNNENSFSQINVNFIDAIKELKISKLLHQCNIRKSYRKLSGENSGEKRTAFEIFQFLLLLVFQGCKLFRFLGSKKQDIACSKSTYHRFLNDTHFNWHRFITLLAAKVVAYFDTLTKPTRFKAFVLDDSVIGRKRSKKEKGLFYPLFKRYCTLFPYGKPANNIGNDSGHFYPPYRTDKNTEVILPLPLYLFDFIVVSNHMVAFIYQ